MIISYELPEDIGEGHARLRTFADAVRGHFEDEPDVKIHVAIEETAQAVLDILEG